AQMLPRLRRDRDHDDALRIGRAIVLADAAANAAFGDDVHPAVAQLDRGGAERAMIDADGATFAARSHANRLVPDRRAHVDLGHRRRHERAAGANVHALQAVAHETGHHAGVNVRGAAAVALGRIDLDTLCRAGSGALAAAAAGVEERALGER